MRLVPRFGIIQGTRPDGSIKVRPVDHFSWSHGPRKRSRAEVKAGSINGHYNMPGSVAHDHLDDLLASMRLHFELISDAPGLVTAVEWFGKKQPVET